LLLSSSSVIFFFIFFHYNKFWRWVLFNSISCKNVCICYLLKALVFKSTGPEDLCYLITDAFIISILTVWQGCFKARFTGLLQQGASNALPRLLNWQEFRYPSPLHLQQR
jgi:hypothetical protein